MVEAWHYGRGFLISSIARALAAPRTFTILPDPVRRGASQRPVSGESLTGGHVKVMVAYSHGLSLDHQGFRPFSPGHREAAGPVGPAVARIEVHCKLQTVTSRALTTACPHASTAVMEVMN